ncbi:hypothetical protein D9611_008811 [Ephemerocybe angulata]|uniref:ABM domain-containing protein n=1 Tax=Ephemerocybe angulata TaxID=980116 RepID=A0A8H5CBZ3_9AGAR|nr:hypothetical protein D9611_008811 [Tulosesus angulatus]
MSPVVEFASFPASDAFLVDPSCIEPLCKALSKAKGFLSAFHGLQVEDKRTIYLVIEWESIDDHMKFASTPAFAKIQEDMKPCMTGPIEMVHVNFIGDHTKPLSCPTTELVMGRPRPGKTPEDFISTIQGIFNALVGEKGFHPHATYGEVVEKPGTYYATIGWDKVEDHKKAVSAGKGKEAVSKFTEAVDPTVVHVNFKECKECPS